MLATKSNYYWELLELMIALQTTLPQPSCANCFNHFLQSLIFTISSGTKNHFAWAMAGFMIWLHLLLILTLIVILIIISILLLKTGINPSTKFCSTEILAKVLNRLWNHPLPFCKLSSTCKWYGCRLIGKKKKTDLLKKKKKKATYHQGKEGLQGPLGPGHTIQGKDWGLIISCSRDTTCETGFINHQSQGGLASASCSQEHCDIQFQMVFMMHLTAPLWWQPRGNSSSRTRGLLSPWVLGSYKHFSIPDSKIFSPCDHWIHLFPAEWARQLN